MTIEIICLVVTIPLLIGGIVISVIGIKSATRSSQEISQKIGESTTRSSQVISQKIEELKPIRPKVQVSFDDKTFINTKSIERNTVSMGDPVISIFFKNIGEDEIRKVEVCVYVSMSLNPIELRYLEKPPITAINQTRHSHPYGVMRFLTTPDDFALIKDESGEVQLVIKRSDAGDTHKLKVHITSANGGCGTHDLTLKT